MIVNFLINSSIKSCFRFCTITGIDLKNLYNITLGWLIKIFRYVVPVYLKIVDLLDFDTARPLL